MGCVLAGSVALKPHGLFSGWYAAAQHDECGQIMELL